MNPHADISPKLALPVLVRLHARLGAQIFENRKEAARLAASMKHVEAVIRLLDPTYDVRRIAVRRRYKVNPWFKRGTIFKCVLDALRVASQPLTSRQIAERMLSTKGITNAQAKPVQDLAGAVQAALRDHEGKAVRTIGEDTPRHWTIVR